MGDIEYNTNNFVCAKWWKEKGYTVSCKAWQWSEDPSQISGYDSTLKSNTSIDEDDEIHIYCEDCPYYESV